MSKLQPIDFDEVDRALQFLGATLDDAAMQDPAATSFMPEDFEYPAVLALVTLLRNVHPIDLPGSGI